MIANIKFIKTITDYMDRERTIVGNYVYYKLDNGNRAKTWCAKDGVYLEIISKTEGAIDTVFLPFSGYFEPVQCHEGTKLWYQHIEDGNCWFFERQYTHVLPKPHDYKKLAKAMENYIEMFE